MLKRDKYLNKLIQYKDTEFIKVIVIPQINTTYKCIRKASLSINTDKGDGQTCFFCGQIKTTS